MNKLEQYRGELVKAKIKGKEFYIVGRSDPPRIRIFSDIHKIVKRIYSTDDGRWYEAKDIELERFAVGHAWDEQIWELELENKSIIQMAGTLEPHGNQYNLTQYISMDDIEYIELL